MLATSSKARIPPKRGPQNNPALAGLIDCPKNLSRLNSTRKSFLKRSNLWCANFFCIETKIVVCCMYNKVQLSRNYGSNWGPPNTSRILRLLRSTLLAWHDRQMIGSWDAGQDDYNCRVLSRVFFLDISLKALEESPYITQHCWPRIIIYVWGGFSILICI